MEVTDVSQLMSLIESGSVSIICDPAQLEESSGDIDNTVLASEETSNTASTLSRSFGGSSVVKEDDEMEKSCGVSASCSEQNGIETNEIKGFHLEVKEKRLENNRQECSQDKSSSQLPLTPEHYFIQMNDGQIIQVLGTLEQNGEGDALPEVSLGEGVGHVENTRDGVQILVVGNNRGEDMYLISTPDKDTESKFKSSIADEANNKTLLEDAEKTVIPQHNDAIMSTLPPSEAEEEEEEEYLGLSEVEDDNCQENLHQGSVHSEDTSLNLKPQDSVHLEGINFKSRMQSSRDADKLINLHVKSQLCNKDLMLSNLQVHKNHQSTQKDKQTLPLKIPSTPLKEGSLVRTDRGDMVAYTLSSMPQLNESGRHMSKLQVVASMFGPAMKVLRPIESKNKSPSKSKCKGFSVYNCSDCNAVLHSEHSLQNHQRKYHKDWEDECFICGKKFLNMQYVRSHIQDTHSSETSFQCRLCPFKCEFVKGLLKHHKSHKESRVCCYCGRKYITQEMYKKHMVVCQEKRNSEPSGSSCESSPVSTDLLLSKQDTQKDLDTDQDMRYSKMRDGGNGNDAIGEIEVSSDISNVRRTLLKTSVDKKFGNNDAEFKFESKHYHQQAKKMALEKLNQPVRTRRVGRERTHRCYLCFKLFSTAAALESHKENFHLAKSNRPVRVKTDNALDEKEDEMANRNSKKEETVSYKNVSEQVEIKEEPMELSEDFEIITIIVDDSVNSPCVIKPLCIACKAYTEIDFRKYSKWFSQIPDDCQSEMLKKFHQFFPCSFDPGSLVEPWMLCKKCVILIDKVADMEEKFGLIKQKLLTKVRGDSRTESIDNENTSCSEDSQTESVPSLKKINIKDIGNNLSAVEAYMKGTCEIMEISTPLKGPGRPKKHVKEKLTPVIVEDKYGGESVSDIVKFVNHDLVKKEKDDTQYMIVTNKLHRKNESETLSKVIVQSEVTLNNIKVKQEPPLYEPDNDSTNSVSWESVSFTNQNYGIGNLCTEFGKRDHKDSHHISTEIILKNFEVASETNSQNERKENLKIKKIPAFALTDSQYQQSLNQTFPPEKMPIRKSHDLNAKDHYRCDMQEPLDSGDHYNKDDTVEDSLESYDCVIHESTTTNDNHPDETHESSSDNDEQSQLRSSFISTEDKQTDDQKPDVSAIKSQGRKRAEIQQERSKMCYKVDGLLLKPWRCRDCLKLFSSERGACEHYAASHKGENYACEHCSASYVRKRDLIGHYNKMHLNIKPYKCKLSECLERFSSHGELYRHMQAAHNTKKGNIKYECHICNTSFAEKRYRDAHLLVCLSLSSDSMPHKCALCQKTFKLARYLQLHMRTVHWFKDEQFFCEICDKVLTDKKNVVIHMKSHMGETKAKCKVCGKEFNRKSYLWTHMRTHTNQRPYKCNYCSKGFNQYSTWKNHVRTHTGEKPYKCYMCSANYATSSSLSKHIQYGHYNIRDYECNICKKKFITKAKVEEHIKVHTGEKPFQCHVCHRAFNKKNNLRNHMYVHSLNKKYKCELCGEGFMRKSTIENHILERHKFDFVIDSNNEDKNVQVEVSTSQFITVKGIDDVPPEDNYIIVFANEDEELSDSKEMQVTVLAEDSTSSQIRMMKGNVSTSLDCTEAITSMDSSTDVLSEVILEDPSGRSADALTSLMGNGISPSITVSEGSNAVVSQVMEIDDTSLRLVAAADTTVPMYPE